METIIDGFPQKKKKYSTKVDRFKIFNNKRAKVILAVEINTLDKLFILQIAFFV